jgi:hypothetical protein
MSNSILKSYVNGQWVPTVIGARGPQGYTGSTGAQGETGLGFVIAKTYSSVAALLADTSPTGIVAGQFAIVETGDSDNPDNNRLYLWSGTAYSYITDLSGAQGIKGETGDTGAQGNIGYTGSTGSAGAQGDQGPIGYTGSTGATGPAGAAGNTNMIILGSSGLNFSATTNAVINEPWVLYSTGGVTGVSVSGSNGTITLPAGTYVLETPMLIGSNNTSSGMKFRNLSDSADIATFSNMTTIDIQGSGKSALPGGLIKFVLSSTKNVGYVSGGSSGTYTSVYPSQITASGAGNQAKDVIVKIYKVE